MNYKGIIGHGATLPTSLRGNSSQLNLASAGGAALPLCSVRGAGGLEKVGNGVMTDTHQAQPAGSPMDLTQPQTLFSLYSN